MYDVFLDHAAHSSSMSVPTTCVSRSRSMQPLNGIPVTFVCLIYTGSPFINYIIQNGFDERHAYIGGMFGAGKDSSHLENKGLGFTVMFNVFCFRDLLCREFVQEQPVCLWDWRGQWLSGAQGQVLLHLPQVSSSAGKTF